MNELIPAILVQDEKTFRERLALVENLVPVVHIDVMDGAFVPNRTWFDMETLRTLSTPVRFELHLMVKDPARYIEKLDGITTIVRALWHIETAVDHMALIDWCHGVGKEAGLALNPQTPIDALGMYAPQLDEILVMGADPGFSGQAMNPQNIERAREIHQRWPTVHIGFDIGVNATTIPELKAAGVTRFCAASAIFGMEDPRTEIEKLQNLLLG